ncbi:TetR/AcrR family transcriptional regulator [Paenibacillus sp. N4]|uniref:TetR/AcrR family transcriptional regulator n=1 Tax=Paenibacillus vietnamensis TaxID=2590547 RepID=UPI001CD119C2|nr:TetR/AcrR family transcriptional regulator [Paenibacillus vietnamensis]MCA0756359.1 TetR/AcrR family transcriptional regulator [Paenibacillus vietnamensis]
MDGYQQRTELKKSAIREAALSLFSEFGFDKVSLAEIARKARVSPVTLYNYFGTKDELIKKVMSSFLEEEWMRYRELFHSNLPFPDKVKKMIFDATHWNERVNRHLLQQLLSDDPEWRSLVERIYKDALPELIRFIEHGKEEGYIDTGISTNTILLYFNLMKEMKMTSLFKQHIHDTKTIDELTHLFFYGLLNQKMIEE